MTEHVKETRKILAQQNAQHERQKVKNIWDKNLKKRRDTYWHSLNNENTAVIYETWYNKENKILPKKFLLKHLPNESQLERNSRKTATFAKFQSEINLLRVRAKHQEEKLKQIDAEMTHFLNSQYESNTLEELKTLWIKQHARKKENQLKEGKRNSSD